MHTISQHTISHNLTFDQTDCQVKLNIMQKVFHRMNSIQGIFWSNARIKGNVTNVLV